MTTGPELSYLEGVTCTDVAYVIGPPSKLNPINEHVGRSVRQFTPRLSTELLPTIPCG